MNNIKHFFLIFLVFVFILGCIFYLQLMDNLKENFNLQNNTSTDISNPDEIPDNCPNQLIDNGEELLLYNTKMPLSNKNPLRFATMEHYTSFVNAQKEDEPNYKCPVLYLRKIFDLQGNLEYRIQTGPNDIHQGIPFGSLLELGETKKFNEQLPKITFNPNDNFAPFDYSSQNIGVWTDVDQLHYSTEKTTEISNNADDPNWGGVEFSKNEAKKIIHINPDKYDPNEI